MNKAYFAAGCFWHVQEEFDKIRGVSSTTVGYTGGKTVNPTYDQVSNGKTGHAEAIEIVFDQEKVSYEKLLKVFFSIHDPTQLDGQGMDIGPNYRSAIFFVNKKQKDLAMDALEHEERMLARRIVTEIKPFKGFYPAEEYHQKHYKNRKMVCGE